MNDASRGLISTAAFERYLKEKRCRCPACASDDLEAFTSDGQPDEAWLASIPDVNLTRYVTTVPALCKNCGMIVSYWHTHVFEWVRTHG